VSIKDGRVSSVSADGACVVIVEHSNDSAEVPVVVTVQRSDMDKDIAALEAATPTQPPTVE